MTDISKVEPTPEINTDEVISKVLAVPDLDENVDVKSEISDLEDEKQENQEIKPPSPPEKKRFVPGGIKTRSDLIRKIQESAQIYGNEAEVKSMRLHRRRRNSLDAILKEQIAKCVTQEAEEDGDTTRRRSGRTSYLCSRVSLLIRFVCMQVS